MSDSISMPADYDGNLHEGTASSQFGRPQPLFGLQRSTMTPPESPFDGQERKNQHSTQPDLQGLTEGQFLVVENVIYTLDQIRTMMQELSKARDRGQFPTTQSSSLDSKVTVEDYGLLLQLRTALSNQIDCTQLVADIQAHIHQRDSLLQRDGRLQDEAAARIRDYLRCLEQERLSTKIVNPTNTNISFQHTPPANSDKINEELLTVVEHAVEQNIADATGPLRMNIARLHQESEDLKDQNDTLSRQIDLHYRHLQQQSDTFNTHVQALDSMFEPQSRNIQAMTQNLTMETGLINHLSQVVMNLPQAINQVVHESVQQQVQGAIGDVMHAQREAMLWIHHNAPRPAALLENESTNTVEAAGQRADMEELVNSITKKVLEQQALGITKRRGQERSRIRRAVGRMFRGPQPKGTNQRRFAP